MTTAPHEGSDPSRSVTRRRFLSVGAAGLAGAVLSTARTDPVGAAVGDPAPVPWSAVFGPSPTGKVVIGRGMHAILDIDATVDELEVQAGGTLEWLRSASPTLESRGNAVVHGVMRMRPETAAPVHTLRFIDVDESAFVGGHHDVPPATDVGLWLRDGGVLDLAGTAKEPWTNLRGAAAAGDITIVVNDASGWRAGDEVVVAPTWPVSVRGFAGAWDLRTITAVSGSTVTLNAALAHDHPATLIDGTTYTAEVANLSRNVRIEGTPAGRAHLHIHMHETPLAQSLSYVGLRHLGVPQKVDRYPIDFDDSGALSSGSAVTGCVARQCGHHAFAICGSDGITFTRCVAFDVLSTAYWWMPGMTSSDVLFDRCLAMGVDDPARPFRVSGFSLAGGFRNEVRNCVATGIQGEKDAAGFEWPEDAGGFSPGDSVWKFNTTNVAHNNVADGIFVWQNDGQDHVVENALIYNCGGAGIDHGAYANVYKYRSLVIHGCTFGIIHHANSKETTDLAEPFQTWDRVRVASTAGASAVRVLVPNRPEQHPTLYIDCSFDKEVLVQIPGSKSTADTTQRTLDFVHCGLSPSSFRFERAWDGLTIRVQSPDGSAFRYDFDSAGQPTLTTIPAFYDYANRAYGSPPPEPPPPEPPPPEPPPPEPPPPGPLPPLPELPKLPLRLQRRARLA